MRLRVILGGLVTSLSVLLLVILLRVARRERPLVPQSAARGVSVVPPARDHPKPTLLSRTTTSPSTFQVPETFLRDQRGSPSQIPSWPVPEDVRPPGHQPPLLPPSAPSPQPLPAKKIPLPPAVPLSGEPTPPSTGTGVSLAGGGFLALGTSATAPQESTGTPTPATTTAPLERSTLPSTPPTTPSQPSPPPTSPSAPPPVQTPVTTPPRFRDIGIPIGEAMDVTTARSATFPLTLTLPFDPREPHLKGVFPELIQPYFFDQFTGQWSAQGLTPKRIEVSEGVVTFETTHLTVFRLGVPRGRPPIVQEVDPRFLSPGTQFAMWGGGFSPVAAQNILTVGGAYVSLALDAVGQPQALVLQDAGETLILQDAKEALLDRAELSAAPASGSSWVRQRDGNPASSFVLHTSVSGGRLFSPGTMADGHSFAATPGTPSATPSAGELIMNEVLLAPPTSYLGDANGDGETNAQEDEFVELVNTTTHTLLLDGCRLLTSGGERHRFPEGTLLPGGMSMVLFGLQDAANPPRPAGPFGGHTFLPDLSASHRLLARLSDDAAVPGTAFVTLTTLRQTSNPLTLGILTRLPDGRSASFKDGAPQLPSLQGRLLRKLRAGDLDRDLDIDLVAIDGQTQLLVLLNDEAGRFVMPATTVPLPDGRAQFFDLAVADMTEDGAPELIIGDTDPQGSYTQVLILKNTGGGRFEQLSSAGILNSKASAGPSTFAVGDVDQDGDLDVVVALIGDGPLIFRNDGTGHVTHQPSTDTIPQHEVVSPTHLVFADVDADGDGDLLLSAERAGLGSSAALQLFLNDGTGRFEDVTASHLPRHSDGIDALAVGDLDGDGDLDVLVGSQQADMRLYWNDGTAHFTEASGSGLASVRARAVAISDVDGDGDLDVITAKPPQDSVFVNDGHGHFSPLAALPTLGGEHRDVLAVDVDNDGDIDVVSAGPTPALLINQGTRINHVPVLTPIAEQTVTEEHVLSLDVHATDFDGDPLTLQTFQRSGEPVTTLGASFTDVGDGTGHLQWTPSLGQGTLSGQLYEFIVRAHDGLVPVEMVVRVIVKKFNHPPTLDPVSPVTVEELAPITITLHATDSDEGDILTFGMTGRPTGATFDSGTGVFHWTPSPTQGDGSDGMIRYPVEFTVTDISGVLANQSTTLTVVDKNHAPQLTPMAPQQVPEGAALTFVIQVIDPDGDPVTLTATELPPGATFDVATRMFQWTPTFVQGRSQPYQARFGASDGELQASLEVQIQVIEVNRLPQFVDLTNQTVDEGKALQFNVTVTDLDGDPLIVSVAGSLPPGATFTSTTHHFQWTPDFTQAGVSPITFQVSDGKDVVQQTIQVTVVNVNRSPVITPVHDQTTREGELLQMAFQVSDPDGDPLTVTVTPRPPGVQVIHQGAPFLFQWVPGMDQAGTYALEVHVSDGIIEIIDGFLVTVRDNPAFQRLFAQVGAAEPDTAPAQTRLGGFGQTSWVALQPGESVGLDLTAVHPAVVSTLELFHTSSTIAFVEGDLELFVSDDNVTYQPYTQSWVWSMNANRLTLSNLHVTQRFIKIHVASGGSLTNFLPQMVRASGAISATSPEAALLEDLAHRAFNYFMENVNAHGLIPDRVIVHDGQSIPGSLYSTAATGFWLAALPMAAERGWVTRQQAEGFARKTLAFFLGQDGGPVAGQFGFFYHFLNGDGTRFTGFSSDGVSIIDSSLLFLGALACGEYFDGEVKTLAQQLYDHAEWDRPDGKAFFDHANHMLRLFWTPEKGFSLHLDYVSEGTVAYLLAAGSSTHPLQSDNDLTLGADAYYAFSHGNFGRVLGRFGLEGRPLLQSFFGSLFAYLYPSLFVDLSGVRDAFHVDWEENVREAIVANFQFAQAHPEFGYSRLFWGLSAVDGPLGYQGMYGAPPLDPGASGPTHDGTVAAYALAGSLPFAADLALPALNHVTTVLGGRALDRYGLRGGVNLNQGFVATEYLGVDQGALLLGIERYQTGGIAALVRQSAVFQHALAQLGFYTADTYRLPLSGPRGAHAYLLIDTTDHLTQAVEIETSAAQASGDFLLELHPDAMDTSQGARFVDVDLAINGQFIRTLRFLDRRGDGTVDVGSVYAPISQAMFSQNLNTITLTWVGGERWLQLEDVELHRPTGRQGTQEVWQIGTPDGAFHEFGDEREVNDSYLVGDPAGTGTFEQAVNVVDEPMTDVLFELSDLESDRLLRLLASETDNGVPVTIEVILNQAVVDHLRLSAGVETTVSLSRSLLRQGWNHLILRHANVPGDGRFVIWDALAFERQSGSSSLQVSVRDVQSDQVAPQLQFGLSPPQGAVLQAQHYLEIRYDTGPSFDRITIATDNRQAPIHRFTGPPEASAAGLVGVVDPGIVAPLLWQVYDERQPSAPPFTDTVQWAFVPDASDTGFGTPETIGYRTLVSASGLGDRPKGERSGSSPIAVYVVADFRDKPAQPYATDRLLIERFEQ